VKFGSHTDRDTGPRITCDVCRATIQCLHAQYEALLCLQDME